MYFFISQFQVSIVRDRFYHRMLSFHMFYYSLFSFIPLPYCPLPTSSLLVWFTFTSRQFLLLSQDLCTMLYFPPSLRSFLPSHDTFFSFMTYKHIYYTHVYNSKSSLCIQEKTFGCIHFSTNSETSIFLYGCIKLCCIYVLPFLHPSMFQWTPRLWHIDSESFRYIFTSSLARSRQFYFQFLEEPQY